MNSSPSNSKVFCCYRVATACALLYVFPHRCCLNLVLFGISAAEQQRTDLEKSYHLPDGLTLRDGETT